MSGDRFDGLAPSPARSRAPPRLSLLALRRERQHRHSAGTLDPDPARARRTLLAPRPRRGARAPRWPGAGPPSRSRHHCPATRGPRTVHARAAKQARTPPRPRDRPTRSSQDRRSRRPPTLDTGLGTTPRAAHQHPTTRKESPVEKAPPLQPPAPDGRLWGDIITLQLGGQNHVAPTVARRPLRLRSALDSRRSAASHGRAPGSAEIGRPSLLAPHPPLSGHRPYLELET